MKYFLFSLSLSVLLFLTAGCKPAPGGGGKVVDVDEGPIVTLTSDKGEVQVLAGATEISLPDAFPDDVPLYQEHQLQLTSYSPRGVAVEFRSPHPALQISDFYQSELAKQGWNVAPTFSTGDTHLVKATTGGNRQVVVLAGPQNSSTGSSVMLTVTDE